MKYLTVIWIEKTYSIQYNEKSALCGTFWDWHSADHTAFFNKCFYLLLLYVRFGFFSQTIQSWMSLSHQTSEHKALYPREVFRLIHRHLERQLPAT
jgi:hypothetical protein